MIRLSASPLSAVLAIAAILFPACSSDSAVEPDTARYELVMTGPFADASSLSLGAEARFEAVVRGSDGSEHSDVAWSLVSGPGAIDEAGTYRAPEELSSHGVTVVLRAVWRRDDAVTGTRTLTLDSAWLDRVEAAGVALGGVIHREIDRARLMAIAYTLRASALDTTTSDRVTRGMLLQSKPDTTFTEYRAGGDSLVAVYADGATAAIRIDTIEGGRSWAAFFSRDHRLAFASRCATHRLRISVSLASGALTITANGTVLHNGERFDVDVTLTGSSTVFDADHVAIVDDDLLMRGTAVSGTLRVELDEELFGSIAYRATPRGIDSRQRSSSTWGLRGWHQRRSLHASTEMRRLHGFSPYSSRTLAKTAVIERWTATGTITRDDATVGMLSAESTRDTATFWLNTKRGRMLVEAAGK